MHQGPAKRTGRRRVNIFLGLYTLFSSRQTFSSSFLGGIKRLFWMIPHFLASGWSVIRRTRFKHNTLISCAWFSFFPLGG